jgi:hypothetical protein
MRSAVPLAGPHEAPVTDKRRKPAATAIAPTARSRKRVPLILLALVLAATLGVGGWYVFSLLNQVVDPWADLIPPPDKWRKEIILHVDMLGGHEEDGVQKLQDGQFVHIEVLPDRDCYIHIWSVEGDGSVIELYPNEWEKDCFFRAGEKRILPEKAKFKAFTSRGLDRIWVEATDRPLEEIPGEKLRDLPFLQFKFKGQQDAWRRQRENIRGIRPEGPEDSPPDKKGLPPDRKNLPAIGEVVIKYKVKAK